MMQVHKSYALLSKWVNDSVADAENVANRTNVDEVVVFYYLEVSFVYFVLNVPIISLMLIIGSLMNVCV